MLDFPILDIQATGERIRQIRVEKQISVKVICEFMGFENPQAIYKWQRGESLPTVDNLYALSKLFETPIENILCEKEAVEEAKASSFWFGDGLGTVWGRFLYRKGTVPQPKRNRPQTVPF